MPRYTVTIARTLTLMTSLAVRAKNEDEAHDTVAFAIESGSFGTVAWQIDDCKAKVEDWQEEDDDVKIDSVEEESCE